MLRFAGRVYVVASFGLLALGFALDRSFDAHFAESFTYTTPVRDREMIAVISRFSLADLSIGGWLPILIALAAVTMVVVFAPGCVPAKVRVALTIPQLLLLPVAWVGALSLPADLVSFFSGRLDGEWFHEGWPILESVGWWEPVAIVVFVMAIRDLLRSEPLSH
jgi:hypothetical protein